MSRPRVLILRAPGTNCDEETAAAWERAGATPRIVQLKRVLERSALLDEFQVLTIPGGFSYGDDLGAGKVFAARLGIDLVDAIRRFHDRGGLILGICNGFQVLVKAGLLPGNCSATITRNESRKFEARWIRMQPAPGRSVFITDDEPISLPVAHGEGRFVLGNAEDLPKLETAGQIVLRYIDSSESPTMDYPANPNGSAGAVAGVCDPTGRIFGLMPHPERNIEPWHHPNWTRAGLGGDGDGLRIFRNAIAAVG